MSGLRLALVYGNQGAVFVDLKEEELVSLLEKALAKGMTVRDAVNALVLVLQGKARNG